MEVTYISTNQLSRSPLQVKIIRVESPTLFWVQLKNGESALRDLHEELNWWMPRRGKALWPSLQKEGEPVVLFHQRRWERGLIEEIGAAGSKVKVALPDWGETAWRRPQDLYQLEAWFRDVCWRALACGLEGVGPAKEVKSWPIKTRQLCRVLMEDQEGTMEIKVPLGPGKCLVALKLRGGEFNVGPIDLKNTLINLGYVRAIESSTVEVKPSIYEP